MEKIVVDAAKKGQKIKKFWSNCIGAGRASEGLRAEWQRQLKMTVKDCGYRYIRFHGLLCDEMGVYRRDGENEYYNYAYIDMLFDALLDMKIRPFVELGFMPEGLASGDGTQFWWKGNVTPPADYDAWARLVSNLVKHWTKRYGLDEVKQWYFEIWNEADLHAFWHGTKSQYFHLYEVSAKAIKEVCEELRVGGPATSNFVPDARFDGETEDFSAHKTNQVEDLQSLEWRGTWILDFLAFCEKKNLPVDFISTHPYPTDFALDGQEGRENLKGRSRYVNSTKDDLTWLRKVVDESAYKNAEIHLTEWSSSPTSRDCSHDSLPVAAYIVKCNLDSIGLVDSLSYWVFTDIFEEAGPGPEAFHGGFGLLTMHGIKKPAYQAYRFLNQLGEELLLKTDSYIVTKNEQGKIRALFYYYPKKDSVPISEYPNREVIHKFQNQKGTLRASVTLTGLSEKSVFDVTTVDETSGNVMALWESFGCPRNLTKAQESELKACADNLRCNQIYSDLDGKLEINLSLKPWSIVFVAEE